MSLRRVRADQLDGLLAAAGDAPGGVLAVMLDDEVVYARGYGLADLEQGVANDPHTVFNLASTSKQFTAFLVLMLEEEGRLSLDDDVRLHLPELHDFGATITLRHLLHHTSGLRDTYPDLVLLGGWRFVDSMTQEDCLRLLRNQRELNFAPGAEFQYANSNYVLLAEIIRRVTGTGLAQVARERVFGPLGMEATVVHDDIGLIVPRRARGYSQDEAGAWHDLPVVDAVLGSTNVHSCADDLVRWVRNLRTGEVGGSALAGRMMTPGCLADGAPLRYAGGLEVGEYRGCKAIEHGGQHGGHCSWLLHLPAVGLSVIALYNYFVWGMRELPLRVVDLYLGGGEEAGPAPGVVPVEVPAGDLEAKAGTYFSRQAGTVRRLEVRGGKLVYLPYELAVTPVAGGRFVFAEEPDSWLEFPEEGGMRLHSDTVVHYERVESTVPGPAGDYLGCYHCPELWVVWWVELEDGALVVRRAREPETTLTSLHGDAFSDDWAAIAGFPLTYTLAFDRDGEGKVGGFRVYGAGVRGLRFLRTG
jgi:CubicO group peptidase (beta-lactamase class C family)